MGEKSKKIGEIGENIVANFFPLLGWNNALSGQTLRCIKPSKHARTDSKSGKRETHGIDLLFCYKSPLESFMAESAVISVKYSQNEYENNPKTTFKSHAKDIAQTLECYKNSELKKQQIDLLGGVKKNRDSGVLFWLSGHENAYESVIPKIANSNLDSDLNFESFHVVDNFKVHFIYDTLTFLKTKYGSEKLHFYYPETSLSYVDNTIARYGKVCPLDFLTAPILPMIIKAKKDDEQDIFCLSSIDNFDQDSLRRLIQAAREYTQDMSCKYLFVFPNYVEEHHKDMVKRAATGFEGGISTRVEVLSYRPDFRSLNHAQE